MVHWLKNSSNKEGTTEKVLQFKMALKWIHINKMWVNDKKCLFEYCKLVKVIKNMCNYIISAYLFKGWREALRNNPEHNNPERNNPKRNNPKPNNPKCNNPKCNNPNSGTFNT